jgi:hypothetical protein
MSLSSRNGRLPRRATATAVTGLLLCPAAFGAEVYYQPVVSLATAYNTNVELTPTLKNATEGYFADAATLIGIATRTSETTLEPRLSYNYFPGESDLNRLEGFLNLNSRYSWQRDRFNVAGFFDHRDDVNAEQPSAEVNPVTPGVGNTSPSTGHVAVGTTRNYLIVDPTYSHALTALSSLGVAAEYQGIRYNQEDSGHVSFNYYMGKVFVAWTHDPRTDFSVNVFGSRFDAQNIDSTATAEGVSGDVTYAFSQALRSEVSATYQRTKFDETDPRVFTDTSNTWGASASLVYTGLASSYRLGAGRSIDPNSSGSLFATEQLRAQYDRDITQRLHFAGALRYFRDISLAAEFGDDTRNYLTSYVKLQWMMTPKLFIAGAYTYVWQKYRTDPSGAAANVVSLTFGYKGLERQH